MLIPGADNRATVMNVPHQQYQYQSCSVIMYPAIESAYRSTTLLPPINSLLRYLYHYMRVINFITPSTGLARRPVPIRYLEIIISVDMDEYKNIYVISQKHTGLREV
ncbi:hypothetical protein CNQ54_25675 (plasmid) [Escherichia coli]|nr:hypothetical protein CNQ54_25675 [Escherichia coli]